MNSFLDTIRGEMPEEKNMRSFQNELLTIDFDKVQAIGDIMLINPRDFKKISSDNVNQQPVVPETQNQSPNEPQTQFETSERL